MDDNNDEQHNATASSRTPTLVQYSEDMSDTEDGQEKVHSGRRSTWRIAVILTALFLSVFLSALDATIVATAVPMMAHDLDSAAGYTWVGSGYLIASTAFGPIWAKLSDIWGRRPMLLSSITVFAAGSVICAMAQSMPMLIAGRVVQGSAGGSLLMLVHICVSDLFSVRQRSLILGLTDGVWACAGGVGPVLGGLFAEAITWRWCYWINLPFCTIAFILIYLFLDIRHEHVPLMVGIKAIDWFGIFSFLAFTIMLMVGLDSGGAMLPWSSPTVIVLLVVGFLMLFVFIYGETHVAKHPLMPMNLFRQRSNTGALLVTFFHALVFMTSEYYLPLYFQSVLGTTPMMSGFLLLPFIVSTAIAGIICGIVIHRTGRFREPIWIGTLLLTLGTGLYMLWGVSTPFAIIIGVQVVAGLGSGLLFEPPLIAIQAQLDQEDTATAISTFTFVRNLGISLSVVFGATMFQNSMNLRSSVLIEAGVADLVVDQLSGKNAAANVMIATSLSDPTQVLAIREAFAWSIRNMYILALSLAFCALLFGSLVKMYHLTSKHTETVTGLRNEMAKGKDVVVSVRCVGSEVGTGGADDRSVNLSERSTALGSASDKDEERSVNASGESTTLEHTSEEDDGKSINMSEHFTTLEGISECDVNKRINLRKPAALESALERIESNSINTSEQSIDLESSRDRDLG